MEDFNKNDENWKWNIFYFNIKDNRIFVPKKNPQTGITLNFANPMSIIVISIFITVIGLLVVYRY